LLFTLFPFQNCISKPNLTRFLFVQANYHKFSTLRETKTDSAIFLDSTPNFIRSQTYPIMVRILMLPNCLYKTKSVNSSATWTW